MKNFLLLLLSIILSITLAQAQRNYMSIGLRGGGTSGITAKWELIDFIAGEGILSFREGGLQLTGLVEFQTPTFLDFSDQFSWYYGVGAHFGYYRGHYHHERDFFRSNYHGGGLALGPDAIIGVEYHIRTVPLVVSFDYKPFIDILRFRHFFRGLADFGFSVRYVFH